MNTRRLLHLAAAVIVIYLAEDSISVDSKLRFFGPIAGVAFGLGWLVYALLFLAPKESAIHRYRREGALLVGSTVIAVAIAVVASALISMGQSANFRKTHYNPQTGTQAQTSDPEIGWAPAGPPDVVGQRLQKVDPSRQQVVMIGDSILYGLHLKDEETAPALMEKRRPEYQFLNLSVSGWSIEQYWLYLRRVLPHTKPKVVVVGLFTGNDMQLTGREYTPWGRSKPIYEFKDGQLVRANRGDNCADGLSQSLLFRGLWRDKDLAVRLVRLLCNPVELPLGELERSISAMFDAMERLGQDRGVPVLFVLLPTRYEISLYAGDRTKYINRYHTLERLLRDGHHEVLDFYPELVKSRLDLGQVFQSDNSHLTALGHKLLADYLLAYLQAHKYL